MALPLLAPDYAERLDQPPQGFTISDGHHIAFDERGDPSGRPCLWFHGSPSCRLEAILLDAFGRTHGHRFIATDRPGIGSSSMVQDWTMLSYARDLVALADHLGFERFSVAGGSGGGPYVLAMAAAVPGRIDKAISLACAGALDHPRLKRHIGAVDRLAAAVVPLPGVLTAYFGALSLAARTPEAVTRTLGAIATRWLPRRDPRLLTLFRQVLKEATRQGTAGVVEDTRLLHQPWGFELVDIRVPIDFVNGTKDEFIPYGYGVELSESIPGSRLHTVVDADHFGTIFDLDRLAKLLAP